MIFPSLVGFILPYVPLFMTDMRYGKYILWRVVFLFSRQYCVAVASYFLQREAAVYGICFQVR